MRTENDICLLCELNQADATNSHIIPKFVTKTIQGAAGPRKAFMLSTRNPFAKRKPQQDTPKQNHILCKSCEESFAVLERIVANDIHAPIEKRSTSTFTSTPINEEEVALNFPNVNSKALRLFVYSILFRCHISTLDLFKNFSLAKEDADLLQSILIKTIKPQQNSFIAHLATIEEHEFHSDIPFLLVTSSKHTKHTRNIIFPVPNLKEPYTIYMGKYSLIISVKNRTISDNDLLVNLNDRVSTVMDISPKQWDIQNKQVLEAIAAHARRNFRR